MRYLAFIIHVSLLLSSSLNALGEIFLPQAVTVLVLLALFHLYIAPCNWLKSVFGPLLGHPAFISRKPSIMTSLSCVICIHHSHQAWSLKKGSFGYYCCCMKFMMKSGAPYSQGGIFLWCYASEHFNNGGAQNRSLPVPTPESHCFIFPAVSQKEGCSWLKRSEDFPASVHISKNFYVLTQ